MQSPFFTKSVLLLSTAALASACVNGHSFLERNSPVTIVTNPSGALAQSEYGDSCVTPCKLRLLLSRGGTIRVTKDDYEPAERTVNSRLAKGFAVAGATAEAAYYLDDPDPVDIVDDVIENAINGNARYKKLETRRIEITLTPVGGAAAAATGEQTKLVDKDGVILLSPSAE